MEQLLIFDKDGCDISDMVSWVDGRGNPLGWSQYKLMYMGRQIGWLESGNPDLEEGYSYEIISMEEK